MGRYDRLIDQLYKSDEDRALARAFAQQFSDVPGMESRIPDLLREAARSAEQVGGGAMSPEDARAYLTSFATEGLGAPAHLVQALQEWQPDPSLLPPEPATEQPQPEPPAAAAQPSEQLGTTPVNTDARIAEIQGMMRAPQGSDSWRGYWMGEAGAKVQQEYRDLLALKTVGAEGPATPAGGAPLAEPPGAAQPAETAA